MIKISRILIAIIVLTTFSCQKALDDKSLLNLNNDIEISVSQRIDGDGLTPTLLIKSTESVECSNASYEVTIEHFPQLLEVNIPEPTLREVCNDVAGYIYTEAPLRPSSAAQKLRIFLNSSVASEGSLNTNAGYYSLDIPNAVGFDISKMEVPIFPKETLTGIINYEASDLKDFELALRAMQEDNIKSHFPQDIDYGFLKLSSHNVSLPSYINANDSTFPVLFYYDDWEATSEEWSKFLEDWNIKNYSLYNTEGEQL